MAPQDIDFSRCPNYGPGIDHRAGARQWMKAREQWGQSMERRIEKACISLEDHGKSWAKLRVIEVIIMCIVVPVIVGLVVRFVAVAAVNAGP